MEKRNNNIIKTKKKNLLKALSRKKRAKESWFKYIMSLLHLWLGLLSSIVIFVVCLTGSIYLFKDKIIDAYNYDKIYVSHVGEKRLSCDSIRAILLTDGFEISTLTIPNSIDKSYRLGYTLVGSNEIGNFYLDPYTGKSLGSGDYSLEGFFKFVLDIHKSLLISSVGKDIVGASILMFVFLLISGLVLWLPKKWKDLKKGFKIKWDARWYRLNYDLHNVLGFYSLMFLLLIAITGLYVSYGWVKSGLIVAMGGQPVLTENASDEEKEELSNSFDDLLKEMLESEAEKVKMKATADVSLDKILDLAHQKLPYQAITSLSVPNKETPYYTITKINRENWLKALLPDVIKLNTAGELKKVDLFADKPLDKQFVAISLPLHTGEILGWPSLILYFIICLIGCSLPITGFIIWWKKV